METANLAGLSQAGAPVMTRGSNRIPAIVAASVSNIAPPTNVSGRLKVQALRRRPRGPGTRVMLARGGDSEVSIIGPFLLGDPFSPLRIVRMLSWQGGTREAGVRTHRSRRRAARRR